MKRPVYIFLAMIVASCQQPAAKQPAVKENVNVFTSTVNDSVIARIQAKEQAAVNQKETTDSLG